jgi:hypothetical protein
LTGHAAYMGEKRYAYKMYVLGRGHLRKVGIYGRIILEMTREKGCEDVNCTELTQESN